MLLKRDVEVDLILDQIIVCWEEAHTCIPDVLVDLANEVPERFGQHVGGNRLHEDSIVMPDQVKSRIFCYHDFAILGFLVVQRRNVGLAWSGDLHYGKPGTVNKTALLVKDCQLVYRVPIF